MVNKEAGSQLERLQKIIASAGICSRRKAEELIAEGRVQVNGEVVTEPGTKADVTKDHIRVDGKLLQGGERHRYYMVNKPKGYVTTVSDPENRPTVMQIIQKGKRSGERVFPVGRLDYASEGLQLLTNDGTLANSLTRASSRVEKTYLVKVSGKPEESALDQIRGGVMIEKGRLGAREGRVLAAPAKVRLIRDAENPWYEMVLIEGRNREIRKMFEEIGHHVEKIRRVGYGPLVLDVEPGEFRELSEQEVERLRHAVRPRKPAKPQQAKERPAKSAASGTDVRPKKTAAKRSGRPAAGRRKPGFKAGR
ncbi:23S rRNA pseudouridine2605 synthase [Silvibacterium bohemicum]|uniref:23S rRNA pseudouridine2605 synthase n=1 Tax=Silvibacterium bohemicum TaxID=1577686 RepID=A0A841K7C8_9BACT|nr:pseudouridine synthase [Silvibacterium bohemicum]MBB6146174.1 23S rRNA pseudouridine2605 synthase [Silvibacterium bohemicum]